MTTPYGKIYTILSEEWTASPWVFELVSIPQEFRDHLVLVLGWTTGRRGYVSIATVWTVQLPQNTLINILKNHDQIIPTIPDGGNPNHCIRIRCPRRRAVPNNEFTVILRKNKRFCALVEPSYVRLDRVWEVPFAILLEVPRTGMQLMLRGASMEKIMRVYSMWGWDQAWVGTYGSRPASRQPGGHCQDRKNLRPPESIEQGGEVEHPQVTARPCQSLNHFASSGSVSEDEDAEAEAEAVAGSNRTGGLDSACRLEDEEHGRSKERVFACARQEMVYAGDAHCAALAKLLRDAQR